MNKMDQIQPIELESRHITELLLFAMYVSKTIFKVIYLWIGKTCNKNSILNTDMRGAKKCGAIEFGAIGIGYGCIEIGCIEIGCDDIQIKKESKNDDVIVFSVMFTLHHLS